MQADIEKLANKIMEEEGKESSNGAAIILGSILTLLLLALLSWLGGGLGPWKVISSLIFGCIGFSVSLASQKAPYKKRSALYILKDQIIKHRPALRRNLNKAFKRNDYGIVASDKRLEIIEEFRVSINFPSGILTANEMLTAIESILGDLSKEDASRDGDLDMVPANPILFEQWVADKLRLKGWDATTTPASGDQGIDVVARKGGVSVGIQCKLYTGAVSNTAVQEVIAGVMYHGLSKGAVLTNATFTQSAVNLAKSANVILMSQYDLSDPDQKLL